MPRRKNLEVTRESDDFDHDGHMDTSMEDTTVPTSEVLLERAREFIQLNRDINELNSQLKVIRKTAKSVEQSLLHGMILSKTEEVECDGVSICRTKNLKISSSD